MARSAPIEIASILTPVGQMLNADAAEHLLNHRLDKSTAKRIRYLSEQASLGQLTSDESKEYDSINNALDMLAILKSEARAVLNQTNR